MKLREFLMRHPYVAFAAAVLIVVSVATIISFATREENSGRIDRLSQVQQQLVKDRKENQERFARSDRLLCQEIEKLKTRDRAAALEERRNLNRNLRLLGIEKTPEIVRLADDNLSKSLAETKPRDCKKLSAAPKKKAPKKKAPT